MFPAGRAYAAGDGNGFTRRTQRHAERPARSQHPKRAIRRRHVADDHGDPRSARLEGDETFQRQSARCNAGSLALAGHRQCRNAWRRNRRYSERRPRRPARRGRRRQRDQRRTRRPAQAVAAERPWRNRQFMGGPGRQQTDFFRRSRQRAGRRPDQRPPRAERAFARRPARRSQPVSTRRRQPSDAGRKTADRKRIVGPDLTPGFRTSAFSKRTAAMLHVIIVGFVAVIIARLLSPGPNNPSGFILTTILGIVGAFLATAVGQAIGHYEPGQGAGYVTATIGALVVLFIWNRLVASRVISDPGNR